MDGLFSVLGFFSTAASWKSDWNSCDCAGADTRCLCGIIQRTTATILPGFSHAVSTVHSRAGVLPDCLAYIPRPGQCDLSSLDNAQTSAYPAHSVNHYLPISMTIESAARRAWTDQLRMKYFTTPPFPA